MGPFIYIISTLAAWKKHLVNGSRLCVCVVFLQQNQLSTESSSTGYLQLEATLF